MHPAWPAYRVFLSYSRRDEKLVRRLEDCLRLNGLTPMRDKHFAYGMGFQEQIKRYIQYAHVFMPLITEHSSKRGWVHEEIGFAIAQNVPVLPVAVECEPREFLQTLHSVILSEKQIYGKPKQVQRILTKQLFAELVNRFKDDQYAVYTCGFLQEDRTKMIADYAHEVASVQSLLPAAATEQEHEEDGLGSRVRQKGALSSFHIPDLPVSAKAWTKRYGSHPRSEHHCRLQREERLALTQHAARWGCRLIINPYICFHDHGADAKKVKLVRLKSLLKFLKSTAVPNVEVAINRHIPPMENITILGNWFLALAAAAGGGRGYYQTIFTRHGPSMRSRIAEFDEEFYRILRKRHLAPADSRQYAIKRIEVHIEEVKRNQNDCTKECPK